MNQKQRNSLNKQIRKRKNNQKKTLRRNLLNELLTFVFPTESLFSKTQFHGNIKWDPEQLVIQAFIWSCQNTQNVTDAFEETLEICEGLGLDKIAKTYTGFMDALARYRKVIDQALRNRLHNLAKEIGGRFYRSNKWLLIGFDGSRVTAPRSTSNELAFSSPTHGKGKKSRYNKNKKKRRSKRKQQRATAKPPASPEPQIWITMMWHMGLRLPWTWRLGPSNSSERAHVQEILENENFPKNTLFCGDAGFIGYPLWSSILSAGGNFLVRVGANVSLLSEHADFKKLNNGIVLCWPKDRMDSGDPPLRLRLIQVKVGKTMMWMLTSVLDEVELTVAEIIEYYKLRWLIEVEFRGLKQTIDKSKLRCRNSNRLLAELDWSLHAMAFAELIALRSQIPATAKTKTNVPYTPKDRSLAETLRVLRRYMRTQSKAAVPDALNDDLKKALVQKYNNSTDKRARYRPRSKDHKPLGDPTVTMITPEHRKKIRELKLKNAA